MINGILGLVPKGALLLSASLATLITLSWPSDSTKQQNTTIQSYLPLNLVSTPAPTTFILDYIVITETPIPTPTKTPTPTPTRTPTPWPYTSSDLEGWFSRYSSEQSVNREMLKKIAACESKFNSLATNGIYGGLFQFSINSWISTRRAMNLDQSPNLRFNPEEAIKTAAFKIAVSGTAAWPNCRK